MRRPPESHSCQRNTAGTQESAIHGVLLASVAVCDLLVLRGHLIADAAQARTSANVRYIPHMSEVTDVLVPLLEEGDLVLTMGAGDITVLPDKLAQALAGRDV